MLIGSTCTPAFRPGTGLPAVLSPAPRGTDARGISFFNAWFVSGKQRHRGVRSWIGKSHECSSSNHSRGWTTLSFLLAAEVGWKISEFFSCLNRSDDPVKCKLQSTCKFNAGLDFEILSELQTNTGTNSQAPRLKAKASRQQL